MSTNIKDIKQSPVVLSELAWNKAMEFVDTGIAEAIRMTVKGGGCSGFTYQLALDAPHADDIVWDQDGLTLALAPDSLVYLNGATLNWKDNLMDGGFEFDNPNAVAACGCGSSFRLNDEVNCGDESAV